MSSRLNIVTNDAGENVRRAHALDLGEDVIVSLHRLVRLTRLHDVENKAFARQLEQTHKLVVDYGLRAGTHLKILFADRVVLIGGQLLKGSHAAYESAMDLGEILAWCGGAELTIARDITLNELKTFSDALSAAMRNRKGEAFASPTPKVVLRQVSDAARVRGLDVERLSFEQRVVRTYASAVVVMRRFFEDLQAGRYLMPRRIKRIAQSLVDLSEGSTPAFLGVTEVRNANHDEAGRAVNTAVLAVAMAREITTDRVLLSQVAMAALMHDVARPRASAGVPRIGGVAAKLSEDAEDQLPAGTAAVLTALGRVNEPTILRTVLTFEALWLRRSTTIGPVYRGMREPTVHARIIAIARLYNDLVTPEPGLLPPSPDYAVAQICQQATDPADRTILRMLVSVLGIFPIGTVVVLTTGETAEVVAGGASKVAPRIRIVLDARGGLITPPRYLDLSKQAPGHTVQIARVVSVDGWVKGLELQVDESDEQPPPDVSPAQVPPVQMRGTPPPLPVGPALAQVPDVDEAIPSASVEIPSSVVEQSSSIEMPWSSQSLQWATAAPPSARVVAKAPAPAAAPDTSADEDDGRTVMQASPFDVEQDDDDEDADARTVFMQRSTVARTVEAAAQADVAPTAEGKLADTPLIHMMVYVLDREMTGTLTLRDPSGDEHSVYFDRGTPTKLRTARPMLLLGEVLIAARIVTPALVDASLATAKAAGMKVGEMLVRAGMVKREALDDALREQLMGRIEWLAKLPGEATFAFYRDLDLLEHWGAVPGVSPLTALMVAARTWPDEARVRSNLFRLKDTQLMLHPDADFTGQQLRPNEQVLLEAISHGPFTVAGLRARNVCTDAPSMAFLYMLMAARLVGVQGKLKPPAAAKRSSPAAATAPASTAAAQRPAAPKAPASAPRAQAAAVAAPPSDNAPKAPASSPSSKPRAPAPDRRSSSSHSAIKPPASSTSSPGVKAPSAAAMSDGDSGPRSRPSHTPVSLVKTPHPVGTENLGPTARGSFSGTPLTHILVFMLDQQASGSVVLREPDGTEHTIYFQDGAAAKVRTGKPIARIGESLLLEGIVDAAQLERALATAGSIEALLGEYLVLEDVVKRAQVVAALQKQVIQKVVALVNLPPKTAYAFYKDVNLLADWGGREAFPQEPLVVILAAVRAWTDQSRVKAAVQRIRGRHLRLHVRADVAGLWPTLSSEELAVMNAIAAGTHTTEDLLAQSVAPPETIQSLVYTLAITRQLTFSAQKHKPMVWRHRPAQAPIQTEASAPATPSQPATRPSEPSARMSSPGSWESTRLSLMPAEAAPTSTDSDPSASVRTTDPSVSRVRQSASTAGSNANAETVFAEAQEALRKGRRSDAELLAARAAQLDPSRPDMAAFLAYTRGLRAHRTAVEEAIEALTTTLNAHPNCELALFCRGKLLRRANRLEAARDDMHALLRLNSSHAEGAHELRVIETRLGKTASS